MSAHGLYSADKGSAAAGNYSLFNCGAGGRQGVFNAQLAFFHFHFGGCAHINYGYAAGQLGKTLLKLFAVVIAGGFFNLSLDGIYAGFDFFAASCALNYSGVVFVHFNLAGGAQHIQSGFLKLKAYFLGNYLPAREDGYILEHSLSAVAEAGGLNGYAGESAADFIDHQGG